MALFFIKSRQHCLSCILGPDSQCYLNLSVTLKSRMIFLHRRQYGTSKNILSVTFCLVNCSSYMGLASKTASIYYGCQSKLLSFCLALLISLPPPYPLSVLCITQGWKEMIFFSYSFISPKAGIHRTQHLCSKQ